MIFNEQHFRLGAYVLREPDYQQIKLWAQILNLSAEETLLRLEKAQGLNWLGRPIVFEVKDGAIISLVWDFLRLPIQHFECVAGLKIKTLQFVHRHPGEKRFLFIQLPLLETLLCINTGLRALNLKGVPRLVALRCHGNQLTELDLSCIPRLNKLLCYDNQLNELDLSHVPKTIINSMSLISPMYQNLLNLGVLITNLLNLI
ncbi:MAG: hypothetical protein NTY92_05255 [Nitrosospira sp.]|nr:hypothetical protein [Nitrosospira sp.]